MDEQRLCNECGRYVSLYKKEPRYVGGHGYLEWITCYYCQEKTQKESSAAMEKLKERVKEHDDKVLAGKLDATQRLLLEYAADPGNLSLSYFATEIHKMYTKGE